MNRGRKMKAIRLPVPRGRLALAASLATLAGPASIFAVPAAGASPSFGWGHDWLIPGELLVTTASGRPMPTSPPAPPSCPQLRYRQPCLRHLRTAVAPGTYPIVFNNDASDGSFGVTEPIVLDEVNPYTAAWSRRSPVPDNPAMVDYLTTSFSSKSELAVNQSTDGRYDTFVGYVAPPARSTLPTPTPPARSTRPSPTRRRRPTVPWPK